MDLIEGHLTGVDGTRIGTYQAGRLDGPVIVLTHGLGGSMAAWSHFVRHFESRFRIVSWDYRGLYRSSRPSGPDTPDAWSIARHCDDLGALLAAEHVEKAVFVGWSMGVQVNLEYYRRRPERFLGLVNINGTAGKPFETAFRAEWFRKVAPIALDILQRSAPAIGRLGPYASVLTKTRALLAFAKAVGLCAPSLDEEVFFALAGDFPRLDFDAYSRVFRALGEHDTRDMLSTVKTPTLVVAGDRDLFTPIGTAREIVEKIPGAEMITIQGGTHYTPIEYPMVVNLRIERFLRERLGLG
jgi:pimeloyl-ACP methyl ester carboxylesterase